MGQHRERILRLQKIIEKNWLGDSTIKRAERKNEMKDYQIIYNEVLTHSFQVEADSEEEAKAKFQKMLENGELDFSYGEITDTSFEIYED